jgi:predicted SAM-dependent methyltransferase
MATGFPCHVCEGMRVPPGRSEWRKLQALDAQGQLVDEVDVAADRFVWEAVRNLQREAAAARAARWAEAEFEQLHREGGLKLNLGCGGDLRAGWVNIDLTVGHGIGEAATGAKVIEFDLRRGLPLADDSCALIYSSHFLEHLEYRHGLALMRDCYRCLERGGLLRLVLPDFRLDLQAYLSGDRAYVAEFDRIAAPDFGEEFELIRGMPPELRGRAMADYVNFFIYQYGEHKTIYDRENVQLMLEHVGFGRVRRSSQREDLDGSDEILRKYSFYIEAVK